MIENFKSLSWKQARTTLQEQTHLLALSKDEDDFCVARTVKEYGFEAGLGVLTAILFFREHGVADSIEMAYQLYDRVFKKEDFPEVRVRLQHCKYLTGFIRAGGTKAEWPLKPRFRNLGRIAGVGNVLLGLALKELVDGGTCDVLAANGIVRFLQLEE